MKIKSILAYLATMFAFMFTFSAFAAEYVVQNGDTWDDVADFTGHSVEELRDINFSAKEEVADVCSTYCEVHPWLSELLSGYISFQILVPGQTLTWISKTERKFAENYLFLRSVFNLVSGEERFRLESDYNMILSGQIAYSDSNPNGVHYTKVLEYVQLRWKQIDEKQSSSAQVTVTESMTTDLEGNVLEHKILD